MIDQQQDILASLELDRLKAVKNNRTTWIVGIPVMVMAGVVIFYTAQEEDMGDFMLFGVGGLGLATFALSRYIIEGYKTAFKKQFGSKVLGQQGFSLKVEPSNVPINNFEDILPHYDRSSFEDLCQGKFEGTELSFFEAELKQRRRSGKHTHYVTVFKGILATFEYTIKELSAPVFIRTNNNIFSLPIPHFFQSGSKVNLEDPVFSKKFEVFSGDQVEARYILTPLMMERLLEVAGRYDGVEAYFKDGKFYMALESEKDLFDPNINAPVDPSMADDILADLNTLTAIIATLKLNSDVHI